MAGRAVESGLVEALSGVLARRLSDRNAHIAAVDLAGQVKLGEFRAYVEGVTHTSPDPELLGRVADALAGEPEIDSATPVQSKVHFSPSTQLLVDVVARCAGLDAADETPGDRPGVIVTFCSPNTNKPLHLGHLRASLLGMSIAELVEASGTPVLRSQMLSNFGIHICQALAIWERDPVDPASVGTKGDWFVGELYRRYHEEASDDEGVQARCAERDCPHCRAAEMLRAMVAGDETLLEANARLTGWVIDGMAATHARIGTRYDVEFLELDTLPLAFDAIREATAAGLCRRRDDGSTFIEVDEKRGAEVTLLRGDGTPLVFTQFLGVHLGRGDQYPGWRIFELTGEQWRSGRAAMYEVLRRLDRPDLAERMDNVWFGMVQLGGATMRSRTGTGVLTDSLLDDVRDRVAAWRDRPALLDVDDADVDALAVALVKYYMLGFSRQSPIDFDDDVLWSTATEGLGRVASALAWADAPVEAGSGDESGAASRALALLLAREGATADRALYKQDPAILVRYLDELSDAAHAAARGPELGAPLRAAFGRVTRRTLRLLNIDLPAARRGAASLVGTARSRPA